MSNQRSFEMSVKSIILYIIKTCILYNNNKVTIRGFLLLFYYGNQTIYAT